MKINGKFYHITSAWPNHDIFKINSIFGVIYKHIINISSNCLNNFLTCLHQTIVSQTKHDKDKA